TRAASERRESPRANAPSRNETASNYNNAPAVSLPRDARPVETPAPAAPRLPEYREVTIPSGTSLPLEMTSTITSASAQVEAPVTARLQNALTINGDTVIPAGSVLRGTVTDVERSGRVKGRAHISFAFNEVSMNGGREDLKTNPLTFEAEATK